MAKFLYPNGITGVILRVKILDSTSGNGKTGLSSSTSGLIISTIADTESSATAYTVAASHIQTITTLGTFVAPSSNECRFKEVDSTNHPGLYEVQIADARWAVSGAKSAIVTLSGVSGAIQVDAEIQLGAINVNDGVRMGLTSLANAAAGANGGLPLAVDASGRVDVLKINGASQTARDIGASVLLSAGTGTGQISLVSGAVLLQPTQTGVTIPTVTTVTGGATASGLTSLQTHGDSAWATATGFATPTNITAGTITTVSGNVTGSVGSISGVTFPTHFTSMLISVAGNVGIDWSNVSNPGSSVGLSGTTVGTITTYTGNTVQTGDAYGRIGSTGSGLTSLAPAATALSTSNYTSSRAGYLDNLNIGGNVASSAAVANISNNTFIGTNVPPVLELAPSGTTSYVVTVIFANNTGAPTNIDASANPTTTLVNNAGTDLSSRLGAWSNPSTGMYKATYTNTSTDAVDDLHWSFAGTVNSVARLWVGVTQLVVNATVAWNSTNATQLAAVYNKLPANNIADETLIMTLLGTSGNAATIGGAIDVAISEANAAHNIVANGGYGNAALSTLIGTPMQAYTQPTGFLSATFPTIVASTTNITGGTVTIGACNSGINGDIGTILSVCNEFGFTDGNVNANAALFDGNEPVQTNGKLWVLDGNGNPIATASGVSTVQSGVTSIESTLTSNLSVATSTLATASSLSAIASTVGTINTNVSAITPIIETAIPNVAYGTSGGLPLQSTVAGYFSTLQSHGDSTWVTATGYAVPGSAMTLANGSIVTATFGTCDLTATMKTSVTTAAAAVTGDTGVTLAKAIEMLAASLTGKITATTVGGVTTYSVKKQDGTTESFTVPASNVDGTRATTGLLT